MRENSEKSGWAIAGAVVLGACWAVTLVAAIGASVMLVVGLAGANGSPQEAAVAALSAAVVVIPCVFTRAIEGLVTPRR